MIALQPTPFHVPHAHILSHVKWSPIRKLCPSAPLAISPILFANVLMKPSVEKIAIAKAYTNTQLMKFGTVVNV